MALTLDLMASTISTKHFNRRPQVKSLIPRIPKGKPKPKIVFNKPRYNGPVYLPKHVYDMLSEEVKKELDECNKEEKATYKPNNNRMAKVHEQDHEDEDPPDNAEPDLNNYYTEDSYPIQDSEIEELIDSNGGYSAKPVFSYHISKHSASSYGSLIDRGANGDLAGADVMF